ncbi:MAG: right-handed parallel beta-helix repeat-containing protein [Gemmatimonadales bacterium]
MRNRGLVVCAILLAGCGTEVPNVVTVAPPTGDRERDRASLRAAFDSVPPGGTIQFAAGLYVIGGDGLELKTSDVTLLGDSAGTVLQGCSEQRLASIDEETYFSSCHGIVLTGGRQQVRSLTFDGYTAALKIHAPTDSAAQEPTANTEGGHVIEGNTFRNATTVELLVDADSVVTVRGNTFRNTYHAVAVMGRNVHVLQNDIAAPEPERVPFGWPSIAIGLRPLMGKPCTGVRIEGNTIDGHTDAVALAVAPPDGPGAACHGNVVRDNTIRVRPLRYPAIAGPQLAGQPLSGVPIRLLNLQQAVLTGIVKFPMPPNAPPWPAAFADAAVHDNVIEGNRISGAIGVAIELIHASGNRIAGNTIEGTIKLSREELTSRAARAPFGIGPGFWLTQPDAATANGRAIYSTPASAQNTISDESNAKQSP